MNLYNTLGVHCSWKSKPGLFGIEIETEVKSAGKYPQGFLLDGGLNARGLQVWDTPMKDWVGNSDGSLRNFGVEFILKEPLSLEATIKALNDFGDQTKDVEFLKDQPSTSVHVHVNMGNETLLTLANFLTVWSLFENLLLEFSGESRRSNLFASGIRTAEGVIYVYQQLFTAIDSGHAGQMMFSESHVKYSALNVATLSRFGSVEARCFRGTTDIDEIIEWIQILNKIYEFSKQPGLTPSDFLSSYRTVGDEILTDVFGEFSSRLKCDGWDAMIDRNLIYTYRLVSCVKNWQTFGLAFPEPKKPRAKKITVVDDLVAMDPVAFFNELDQTGSIPQPWADVNTNIIADIEEDADLV